jgi:hypothetical protein
MSKAVKATFRVLQAWLPEGEAPSEPGVVARSPARAELRPSMVCVKLTESVLVVFHLAAMAWTGWLFT